MESPHLTVGGEAGMHCLDLLFPVWEEINHSSSILLSLFDLDHDLGMIPCHLFHHIIETLHILFPTAFIVSSSSLKPAS